MIFRSEGKAAVAPTWSPDSDELLFAVGKDLARHLFIIDLNGREPRLLNDQIFTPGRIRNPICRSAGTRISTCNAPASKTVHASQNASVV